MERGTGLELATACLEARLSGVSLKPRNRLFEFQAGRRGFCPQDKGILTLLNLNRSWLVPRHRALSNRQTRSI
jgi:hypothetical protein